MFKIVFSGQLVDGVGLPQATKNLQILFGVDEQFVKRMLSSAPVVLQRCSAQGVAEEYVRRLVDAGFICQAVPDSATSHRDGANASPPPHSRRSEAAVHRENDPPSQTSQPLADIEADRIPCRYCGESILPVALKCKHCGSQLGPSPSLLGSNPSSQPDSLDHSAATEQPTDRPTRSPDLGLVLIGLPAIGTLSIWFWIAQLALIQSPGEKLSLIIIFVVVGTAIAVALEASGLGMVTDKHAGTYSPTTWFFLFLIIWFLAYPTYLYKRKQYRRSNLLLPGILVTLLFLPSAIGVGIAIEEQYQKVRTHIQQTQSQFQQIQRETQADLEKLQRVLKSITPRQ
jgi:hypothetical protein